MHGLIRRGLAHRRLDARRSRARGSSRLVLDRFARCPPARVMRVRVRHLFVSKYLVRKSKTARAQHARARVRGARREQREAERRPAAAPLLQRVERVRASASLTRRRHEVDERGERPCRVRQAAGSLAPRLRARDAKESVSKLHRGRSVFDGKILSAHVERWRSSHAIKRHIVVVRSGTPSLEPRRRGMDILLRLQRADT